MDDFSWSISADKLKSVLQCEFEGSYFGSSLYYDDTVVVGAAKNNGHDILVGCRGLGDSDSYFNLIRSVFHEVRHIQHDMSNFSCCEKYATECRIDAVACCGSSVYYGINGNDDEPPYPWYYENIREVDAEHHGIFDAYKFLLGHMTFYSGDVRSAFLGFINDRFLRKAGDPVSYYISFDKPITSLSDLDSYFKKQLEVSCASKHVGYDYSIDMDSCVGVLMSRPEIGWTNAAADFRKAKTGFDERRIIAGVVRAIHPEYTKDLTFDEKKLIGTWNTFHTATIPHIPQEIKEEFGALPDEKRRKYYSVAIDKLSVFNDDCVDVSDDFMDEFQ